MKRFNFRRFVPTGTPAAVFSRLSPEAWDALGALAEIMVGGQDAGHQFGTQPTLLDIAVMNGSDAVAGLIDEAAQATPELTVGYARPISGINYKTLVRTAVPSVSFRNANEGTATTKGTYENKLFETHIMDPEWTCDQAIADRHEDGAEAFIALEASGIVEGAFQTLGTQFYYGITGGGDAKGFPGLIEVYDGDMDVLAGGSTASTQTSLWAVRFGPKDVGWIWGNNGTLDVSDATLERVLDDSSNPYWAYCQHLISYPGLQVCSKYSIGRVANIHPSDSNAQLTDTDIANLLAVFPVGKPPTHLFLNRAALAMLRNSRTATNATGAPAPFPTEAFGIPLVPTDSITSTEEVAT